MDDLTALQVTRGLLVGSAAVILYSLPTIIAVRRKRKNRVIIALLNYFLGWTIAGWIVAFLWARSAPAVDTASAAQS